MTNIDNKKLQQVAGGNTVEFADGQPVCPVCGAMGSRMKIIEQTAYSTTYQCELCNQVSTSAIPQPETPVTSCAGGWRDRKAKLLGELAEKGCI